MSDLGPHPLLYKCRLCGTTFQKLDHLISSNKCQVLSEANKTAWHDCEEGAGGGAIGIADLLGYAASPNNKTTPKAQSERMS